VIGRDLKIVFIGNCLEDGDITMKDYTISGWSESFFLTKFQSCDTLVLKVLNAFERVEDGRVKNKILVHITTKDHTDVLL